MPTSVYTINKGINRPIEFKGLKAQYIGWLAAGLLLLLIVFALLYILGLHPFLSATITIGGGTAMVMQLYQINHRYGQYGLMKAIARRNIPAIIKLYSRNVFTSLAK